MGGGQSREQSRYVKVMISKATGLAAKFTFERGTGDDTTYKMLTIYTNPGIVSKESVNITKEEYDSKDDSKWDWYEYDGDVERVLQIFENFDPQPQNLGALLTQLEMECEMKKYKGFWEKVKEFLDAALTLTGRVLGGVIAPVAMPLLYARGMGLLNF